MIDLIDTSSKGSLQLELIFSNECAKFLTKFKLSLHSYLTATGLELTILNEGVNHTIDLL